MLTEYVINHGHKRIALMVSKFASDMGEWQVNGYKEALEGSEIRFDPTLLWEKDGCFYPPIIDEILNHEKKPTALLAFSTTDVPIILSVLLSKGCRVPEDLSFVGWQRPGFASLDVFPEITCISGSWINPARVLVERLLERVKDVKLPCRDIQVEHSVDPGRTCSRINNSFNCRKISIQDDRSAADNCGVYSGKEGIG